MKMTSGKAALLMTVVLAVALVGCGSPQSKDVFVGDWVTERGGMTMTIKKDGNVYLVHLTGSTMGDEHTATLENGSLKWDIPFMGEIRHAPSTDSLVTLGSTFTRRPAK
jgi:hypothetical protein